MRYFFPIHVDGGNRGCEAISKSSALLVEEASDHIFGYSRDMALDAQLGLDKYLTLIPHRRDSWLADRFLAAINKLLNTPQTNAWRQVYPYKSFLRLINHNDVVVFGGGDMMCYDDNELIFLNNWLHRHNIKTILWGCSMGPENQSEEKLRTLSNFTLIYTRESLTYDYFQSLGLQHLCLLPDPAFILSAEEHPLPHYFCNANLLGLNFSNYTMGGITLDSPFGREAVSLINHILDKTSMDIVLIPHVTWNRDGTNQDDRQMADLITRHFNGHNRIHTLDIDHMNYCQIRYAISRCRMFIGSRTHAVISAYSMCVPTIAIGYSIKSRGIAKDLGLDARLIVNSKDFAEGDLLKSFNHLMQNEDSIRHHLQSVMPSYIQTTYGIRKKLQQL